jgi:hypothetical protein
VLPDALEKHCIQAERIVDKNHFVGKKRSSTHLPLWICRRFSTDALVSGLILLPELVCFAENGLVGRIWLPSWQRRPLCHFLFEDINTLA